MSTSIKVQRVCQHCGNEFTAQTTVTLYCSKKCNSAAYKAKIRAAKVEASNSDTKRVKNTPIEKLKAKEFLSINETSTLIGISRRTIYRLIERGELVTGKAGKRSIIRRSDIEQLLFKPQPATPVTEPAPTPVEYEISECYTLNEIQQKYSLSESTVHHLIKRNGIQKMKKGWYAYVPKNAIDNLLNPQSIKDNDNQSKTTAETDFRKKEKSLS